MPGTGPAARRWAAPRAWIAGATGAALAGSAAFALIIELRHYDRLLIRSADETQSLTQKVRALDSRLADIADLRRSVGETKTSLASVRDVNGAIAQLSQRLEKLDRDESARTADLSARIEKMERKVAAQAVPSPPPPAPPFAAPAKAPVPPIKSGSGISMETTGSIQRSKPPVLRGYIVLDAQDGVALLGGRYGEQEARPGDFLPGAGRVLRIERQGRGWVVLTSQGLIAAADLPPD